MKFFLLFLLLLNTPSLYASADFTIERSLDGETLLLTDGRRIHLIGVNTTNIHSSLSERYKLTADQISRLPLSNVIPDAVNYIQQHAAGKNIILSYDPANESRGHLDESGRMLAYVWYTTYTSAAASEDSEGAAKYLGVKSQDRLLNQELISMGLGLVDTKDPFIQQEAFLEDEKRAAEAKRGFWRSASELYQELMGKAQGSQSASTAGFVDEKARELSLQSARATYDKLIEMNPKDFHPYYERSWLGANALHNKVTRNNLEDIDKAISLSPFQPQLYMQRVYLLRLLGRPDEAIEAYARVLSAASKLGMRSPVSELAEAEIEKSNWSEEISEPVRRAQALQAVRATLNEDHFLFFMARYLSYKEGEVPENMKSLYEKISKMGRFAEFESKHEELLSTGDAHAILYQTQWAQNGLKTPEDAIKGMEMLEQDEVKAA